MTSSAELYELQALGLVFIADGNQCFITEEGTKFLNRYELKLLRESRELP